MPPRSGEPAIGHRDPIPPPRDAPHSREGKITPRDPVVTPRDSDVSPRDSNVISRDPPVTPRDPTVTPRDPAVIPRDPTQSPRDPNTESMAQFLKKVSYFHAYIYTSNAFF